MREKAIRRGEAGFTLMELLVAMAILSIALVALLNVTGENTRAADMVRTRLLAEIVAENRLIEAQAVIGVLPPGVDSGEAELAGQSWIWRQEVAPTPNPLMERIDVTITRAGAKTPSARLTAFREAE